ncbi:GDSL-type esterase/lipase family protein [Bacillus timonensis]|nr:GDSL-type esterase/lipase family protein [Bacillus timonensis]
MKFKSLSLLFLIMLLVGTFLTPMTSANTDEKPMLVALGDSITYGYNLDPANPKPSENAFPSLIGNGENDVVNLGVPGWKSSDLLAALTTDPTFSAALLKADFITLNIGSNDFLQHPDVKKILKGEAPPTATPELIQSLQATSVQLGTNLQAIFAAIRSQTDAPIVFYNLYNPFGPSTHPTFAALHLLGEQIITGVNKDVILPIGVATGSLLVDSYSAFNGNQATYILPGDVHPTFTGHQALAALADAALLTLVPKEITINFALSTTEETSDPVVVTISTGEEVVEAKWLAGEKLVADFADAGTLIEGNIFEVTENGTYTIYVKNAAGVESVKTFTVSNIVVAPVEEPTEEPVEEEEEAEPVTTPKNGHQLPNTATPVYNLLVVGIVMLLVGTTALFIVRRKTVGQN